MIAFQPLLAASRLLRSRVHAAPSILNRSFHRSPSAHHNLQILLPCSILQSSFAVPFLSTSPTLQSSSPFSTRPPKPTKRGIGRENQDKLNALARNRDGKGIIQFIDGNYNDFDGRNKRRERNSRGITTRKVSSVSLTKI